jgi:carboxyl-terminal processing protease
VDQHKNSKSIIRLPLLLGAAIAAGILIGSSMMKSTSKVEDSTKSLAKFKEIVTQIEGNYVDEVDTEELIDEAIRKMLEKLDPHTAYIPKEDMEIVSSQLQGKFEGIGIEFNIFHDTLYVVSPLSGGPSEKVGLRSGDKIVTVDGETIAGVNITNKDVFDKLRGPKGSVVKVGILRRDANELQEFNIERDKIPQYSVDVSYMVSDEIGYIKVSRFSATTFDEFKVALKELKDQNMKKLILDLTGNPGGYMDRAINMADEFLSGSPMIVYTKSKESRYNSEHRANSKGDFEEGALAVLIDAGSASASEIVSGAIQDNDRGLIIGRRSFGKGLVQMPIALNDGSELRLTISRYYTPSGRSIQKPYEMGGNSDYRNDYRERAENGEFFSADSIAVNDSLVFKTSKGRTVYGGGGIMPDIFVALDTTTNSSYLNKLFFTNTIREYSLNYYESNITSLSKYKFEDFRKEFEVSNNMLKKLIELAEKNKISYNEIEFNRSKPFIKMFIKSQIARSLWDNKGFYPIFNESNEIFNEAVKVLEKGDNPLFKN